MNNEQRLLMLRLSHTVQHEPSYHLYTALAPLGGTSSAKEVVDSPLDLTLARTRGLWKPHDTLEERGCGSVPQLYLPQPSDVPRLGGAIHAETSQGSHMVQRLAGGRTGGGHKRDSGTSPRGTTTSL